VSKLRIPYHQLKILIQKKSFGLKQRNTLWYSETIRVTVEDLNKLNPTLQKSGLKKGDKIRIPGTESNQNLAVFFVEPIKETQKILSEKKIVQKEETFTEIQ
jgi:hypothetical protein